MSSSGSSQPPGPPPTGYPGLPPARGDQTVKVENVTGALSRVTRPQRVEGEVTRINRDGSVRIRTSGGDLDVSVRRGELPQPGQRVEVDVSPGRPPRQAIVRPAPDNTQQPQPQRSGPPDISADTPPQETDAPPQTPRASSSAPPRTTDSPPASSSPPAPEDTAPDAQTSTPAPVKPPPARLSDSVSSALAGQPRPSTADAPVPPPLKPGDIVRLTPLPPAQAGQVSPALADAVEATLENTMTLAAKGTPPALLPAALAPLAEPTGKPIILPASALKKMEGGNVPAPATPAANGEAPPFSTSPLRQNPDGLSVMFSKPAHASFLAPLAGKTNAGTSSALPASGLKSGPVLLPADKLPSAGLTDATLFSAPRLSSLARLDLRVTNMIPPDAQFLPTGKGSASLKTFMQLLSGNAQKGQPFLPSLHSSLLSKNPAAGLRGEVTGITPQGFPVVSLALPGMTEPAFFVMQFPAPGLAPGTQIEFATMPGTASAAAGHQPLSTLPPLPALPPESMPSYLFGDFEWPALQAAQQIVAQVDPQVMQTLARILPNAAAPERIPAAALFFLAAIRSGDLGSLLGEKTLDILRRSGRADIISRLSRDFASLSPDGDSGVPAQDWRALAMPLFWQEDLHKMILYYRQGGQEGDKDGDKKESGTRFIFDLKLNRMGPVQLDGLHRANRLDLIVRTENACSETMRNTMLHKWVDILEQAGMSGELSFQNKPEQFIKIAIPARPNQVKA